VWGEVGPRHRLGISASGGVQRLEPPGGIPGREVVVDERSDLEPAAADEPDDQVAEGIS
jgi:hypothetical protein